MNKIRSLFAGKSKEKEPTFIKEDICIFAEYIDILNIEDYAMREDGYVIIGYYNKDGSKFKDILTGRIYKSECLVWDKVGNEARQRLISDDRDFYPIGNLKFKRGLRIGAAKYEVYIDNKINWLYYVRIGTEEYSLLLDDYVKFFKNKYMPLVEFTDKQLSDDVSLSEILKMGKILNNIAYNYVEPQIKNLKVKDDYKEF